MNLCIFLPTGRTYSFKNVTIICDNETILEFEYKAMSDGLGKTAKFQKANFAGYSVYYPPPPVTTNEVECGCPQCREYKARRTGARTQ